MLKLLKKKREMLLIFRSQNPPPLQQHYLVHEREIIIHTIWILLSFKTMLYIVVTKLYFSFDLEFINFPFHFDCHCICSIQKCTSVQKKNVSKPQLRICQNLVLTVLIKKPNGAAMQPMTQMQYIFFSQMNSILSLGFL